ncbi:hypothetical protein [uncultured Sphingomonas sp.]|uniref:hypothetical protein n=1 Tax=uncultured Sphingomonas sp. TaxID=158754 RepID=UPI0035CA8EB2
MSDDVNRRETLGTAVWASLQTLFSPASRSDDPAVAQSLQSVAFVTTLAAARSWRFDDTVGIIVLGGFARPGDGGAGRVMVRDLSVDPQRVAADPTAAFIDRAGMGFSAVPQAAGTALRDGPLLNWLVARTDQFGATPFAGAQPRDIANGRRLQVAFDALADENSALASVTLPRGNWSLGPTQLSLRARRANLAGQGISVTYLHTEIASGGTALTLRNYGGDTTAFALDSGAPAMSQEAARNSRRNGILFDWSGGHGSIRSIETRWFNGFGMRFVNIWDSIVENVITVGCGSDEHHAIEFVSAGDTTNHTNVNRLQAEDSVGRAILFDAGCLNMCVDNIHCEGTVGRRGQYSISLLGTAMSYRNARIANDGGNVDVLLGGAGNVYDRFSFEAGVIVDYATGEIGRSKRSFVTHCVFDRLRVLSRNRGMLVIADCTIEQLEIADQAASIRLVRCIIGNVSLSGNQTDVSFDDCDITGRWQGAGNVLVRARNCRMANGPMASVTHLYGCIIDKEYVSSFNQQIHAVDCTFEGNVVLDNNGARIWLLGSFIVAGALSYRAGSAFGACSSDGRVAGDIHPNWYGTGGTWPRGTLRARLDAGRGTPPYTRFDGRSWSAAAPLS